MRRSTSMQFFSKVQLPHRTDLTSFDNIQSIRKVKSVSNLFKFKVSESWFRKNNLLKSSSLGCLKFNDSASSKEYVSEFAFDYNPIPMKIRKISRRHSVDDESYLNESRAFASDLISSQSSQRPKISTSCLFNLMKSERERLNSFLNNNWPLDYIKPEELAKAGLFYLLKDDCVQCAFCKISIWGWTTEDIPLVEHLNHNPRCQFISGYNVGNIPLTEKPTALLRKIVGNLDVYGSRPMPFANESVNSSENSQLSIESHQNKSGVVPQQVTKSIANNESSAYRVTSENLFTLMKSERERLQSFLRNNWPLPFIKPQDLAKAGYFYTLQSDKVMCAFCRYPAWDWEPGDIPLREHFKHNNQCPFLLGENVGNISLMNEPFYPELVVEEFVGDIIPSRTNSPGDLTVNEYPSETSYTNGQTNYSIHECGINTHRCENPSFYTLESRLKTFEESDWSEKSKLNYQCVAEAGFYYLGEQDNVQCFSCGGCLCSWEEGDNPWVEHALWFSDCEYIRLNKGHHFVESCKKMNESKTSTKNIRRKSDISNGDYIISDSEDETLGTQLLKSRENRTPINNVCSGSTASTLSPHTSDSEAETLSPILNQFENEDRLRCKICLQEEVGVVFLPCGHMAACTFCAPGLKDCPICRENIVGTVKVYLS